MRQRRRLKALLNDGFSATVSLRALISLLPIVSSFAHDGIKPQRIVCRCLLPLSSATMELICDEGAIFHEGEKSRSSVRSKYSVSLLDVIFSVNLPHMSVFFFLNFFHQPLTTGRREPHYRLQPILQATLNSISFQSTDKYTNIFIGFDWMLLDCYRYLERPSVLAQSIQLQMTTIDP